MASAAEIRPQIDVLNTLRPAVRDGGMKRRELIFLFGGAAATWPLATRAQQKAMPVIGYLSGVALAAMAPRLAAFHQGLNETGYVEGQNVAIEYRAGEGDYDRLAALAAELVGHRVNVIASSGGIDSALAAKSSSTIRSFGKLAPYRDRNLTIDVLSELDPEQLRDCSWMRSRMARR
jgi:hypothetical protein